MHVRPAVFLTPLRRRRCRGTARRGRRSRSTRTYRSRSRTTGVSLPNSRLPPRLKMMSGNCLPAVSCGFQRKPTTFSPSLRYDAATLEPCISPAALELFSAPQVVAQCRWAAPCGSLRASRLRPPLVLEALECLDILLVCADRARRARRLLDDGAITESSVLCSRTGEAQQQKGDGEQESGFSHEHSSEDSQVSSPTTV